MRVKSCEGYDTSACMSIFLFACILIRNVYDNILVYQYGKSSKLMMFFLVLEIMLQGLLIVMYIFFIANYPGTIEVVLNLAALMTIVEFSSIICNLFDLFMHKYFKELSIDEQFLKLEHTAEDQDIAFNWSITLMIIVTINAILNYFDTNYVYCPNFDSYKDSI